MTGIQTANPKKKLVTFGKKSNGTQTRRKLLSLDDGEEDPCSGDPIDLLKELTAALPKTPSPSKKQRYDTRISKMKQLRLKQESVSNIMGVEGSNQDSRDVAVVGSQSQNASVPTIDQFGTLMKPASNIARVSRPQGVMTFGGGLCSAGANSCPNDGDPVSNLPPDVNHLMADADDTQQDIRVDEGLESSDDDVSYIFFPRYTLERRNMRFYLATQSPNCS
jgi:hypothetical protein